MHPQLSRTPNLSFGPFEFNPSSGELSRHGYKVKLAAQPGEILVALLDRPGDVVSREDLRNRLWPGTTTGDFEHGLNAAVNKLRQSLSDSAEQPLYIETLPGRGYRFVAPVRSLGRTVLEMVPNALPPAAGLQRKPIPRWAAGLVAALMLAGGGATWLVLRNPHPPAVMMKPAQFRIAPPPGYYLEGGGIRQSFAVSPDGNRIAFTAKDTGGVFHLFLRDLAELESRPVPDGEGAYSVVWTPDGRSLLFTAKRKLWRLDVPGAVSQVVSDSVLPYFGSAIPFGPGQLLVSNYRSAGLVPSAGGKPQAIEQPYTWAQQLPGGQQFLYTVDDPAHGVWQARVAASGGKEAGVDVLQADSRVQYTGSLHSSGGYLVYLRAGTLLAQPFDLAGRRVTGEPKAITRRVPSWSTTGSADFSVSDRGVLAYQSAVNRSQLIWVDRTGKRLSAASPAEMNTNTVRLSPDGRWIAAVPFDFERGVPEIWVFDAVTGAGRRTVFGPGVRHAPVWSPDSQRLAHMIAYHEWPRLGITSLDGTPEKEALPHTGFMLPTDWSPDGRFLLYNNSGLAEVSRDFPSDVFAIDLVRNRKVIPLLSTPFHEWGAAFSPDGKWLAFLSTESGHPEIYAQALDRGGDSLKVTGQRYLISRQGAQCLRWRKDAREIYYLGGDGRVYSVALTFGSDGIRPAAPVPLFSIDAEARAVFHSVLSFDVSADGSRFVIPSMTPGESSALVVLQNWERLAGK